MHGRRQPQRPTLLRQLSRRESAARANWARTQASTLAPLPCGSVELSVSPIPALPLASRRWWCRFRPIGGDGHFMKDGISRFDQRYVLIPGSWCFATNLNLAFRPVSDAFELVSHEHHSDLCCHSF